MTCKYFCKCSTAIDLLNRNNLGGEIKIFYKEKCDDNGNCGGKYDGFKMNENPGVLE